MGRPPGRRARPARLHSLSVHEFVPLPKRKYDGFFPLLSAEITAGNRKKRKLAIDIARGRTAGAPFTSPLAVGWSGFSLEECELLKASHKKKRSYYGGPAYRCSRCGTAFWFQERVVSQSAITLRRIVYNLCCKAGKVFVPPFKQPPAYLQNMLRFDGGPQCRSFIRKIRQYNCLFAFTSMGATVDRSVNDGNGPNIYKITGQVHHRIGTLMPEQDVPPKFAELYIYDTQNEVKNRIKALNKDDNTHGDLDPLIVQGLMNMLDECNPLVKTFRLARERLQECENIELSIRLIAPGEKDGPQFSLPSCDELAVLIVGNFTLEAPCRDIVVHARGGDLQRISSLHPAYMALQYPLLFTYGERGFQLGVKHIRTASSGAAKRDKLTMQDYYAYCCHYKEGQYNPYLCCGLLSTQAVIDARACIDECRLRFIIKCQEDLRAENLQGITDAVGQGRVDGNSVGKKNILPSSYTGGRRYMIENFQDAVAISRVHGPPDLFSTFTCNPKWPEIKEALLLEPGQVPTDRADLIVRVYNLKLNEYLSRIKRGKAYGPVKAVLHTVEFQKRGLPHAHILIWLQRKKSDVMPFTPLSDITQGSKRWEVIVLFSRLWCYRGGTDKGPIKHMDAVVLDKQGNCMYVQISAEAAKRFEHLLHEGKVYSLRNILVSPSKTAFRPVEAKNMINITKYTRITEHPGIENEFPLCTYNVTSFTELPKPAKAVTNFVDVIGKIVAVSEVFEVHPMNQAEPSSTRTVVLQDLLGHELKLLLWGDRAVEFDADQVVSAGAEEHVVAIFVGTLPKNVEAARGLSGSAACRWYINEDIPDINSFKSSLGDTVVPVTVYTPPALNLGAARARATPKVMTVKELNGLNPFEDPGLRYVCDVTITRLVPNQRWWFCSCNDCHKSAVPGATDYTCSNPECASKDADPTYCIATMASDGTEEAEFVFFDRIGREVVGKPLITILRQNNPGLYSVIDVVKAARFADVTPIEISRLVGQKYQLVVSISAKSFSTASEQLSFQVNRIEHTYDQQVHSSLLGSPTASSSRSAELLGSPLTPISALPSPVAVPGTVASYDQSIVLSSPQVLTAAAAASVASPGSSTSPASKTVCPPRGTKRSLFGAGHGSKKAGKTKTTADVKDVPAGVDSSSDTLDPADSAKGDKAPVNNKRGGVGKGSGKGATPK